MKNKLRMVGLLASVVGLFMALPAWAGDLVAPAGPANSNSAMFTLNDIYNKLDTGVAVAKRTGGFAGPTAGPTNGTMHTLNAIMTLVTNRAPVPKTGQTTAIVSGDDGALQEGLAWPNPRFTIGTGVDGTNCVTDNLTGLIWARNANLAFNTTWATGWSSVNGTCTWDQAFDVITNSAGPVNGTFSGPNGYGGTNDWRLPNLRELFSLSDARWSGPELCNTEGTAKWTEGHPFTGVTNSFAYNCWSSTTYVLDTTKAWYCRRDVDMIRDCDKTNSICTVWPVRGGR